MELGVGGAPSLPRPWEGEAVMEVAGGRGDTEKLSWVGPFLRTTRRYIWSHDLREVLQIPRASLVAQLVKNPPAMQETLVQSLGWEDPLEKGKATHSSTILENTGLENSRDSIVHGVAKSQTRLSDFHFFQIQKALRLTILPWRHQRRGPDPVN